MVPRTISLGGVALAATLAAGPTPLAAQGGFWMGGGVGVGFGGVSCIVCSGQRDDALSANIRLGGTLNRWVLLGVEGTGWRHEDADFDFHILAVNAVAFFYPTQRGDRSWYLKAGAGALAYRVREIGGGGAITARGGSGQFEIGYAFDLSRGVGFAPFLNFTGSMGARLTENGESLTAAGVTLIQLGVALTVY